MTDAGPIVRLVATASRVLPAARLYRLEPVRLRPLHEWLAKHEQAWNDRLDRVDDYLKELPQGERQ
jgi:hypothetical protein